MSVKICLLRTGETVIGDLKEVLDPVENKSLGYKIQHPYIIDFTYVSSLVLDENGIETGEKKDSTYAFKFWAPLSSEREFNFNYDFVEVIYAPHKVVEESYNTIVNHYIEENTISVQVDGTKTITSKKLDIEKSIAEENAKRIEEEAIQKEQTEEN
jgi:hypothetical protein